MITNKLSEIAGRKRIKMSEIARMTDIGYSQFKDYTITKLVELNLMC